MRSPALHCARSHPAPAMAVVAGRGGASFSASSLPSSGVEFLSRSLTQPRGPPPAPHRIAPVAFADMYAASRGPAATSSRWLCATRSHVFLNPRNSWLSASSYFKLESDRTLLCGDITLSTSSLSTDLLSRGQSVPDTARWMGKRAGRGWLERAGAGLRWTSQARRIDP